MPGSSELVALGERVETLEKKVRRLENLLAQLVKEKPKKKRGGKQ